MFALIALSSNSQISIQKSISLPNLLRIAEQRKKFHIEIVLSLDKNLLVKGLGEQNELFRLSRTSRPSSCGNYNEDWKIDPINAGLEFRD